MRVCIAVPPISDFYFSERRMSALGARVVQRLVESAGHEAVLMDFPHAVRKPAPVARPEALSYLDPFIIDETGPVSFFTGYKRLGPEPSQCARMIAEIQPDLLLISCFAYAYAEDTASLARAVHAVAPRLSIVAGGPGPTALPEKFLRTGPISFVLAGEAETNLPQFLAQFSKGDPDYSVVPGFFTLEGGRMFLTKPRRDTTEDELKWVGAISKEKRGDRGGRRLTTSLSRGCPRSCAFCSNHLCHGRDYRKIPLERVFAGIDSAAAEAAAEGTGGGCAGKAAGTAGGGAAGTAPGAVRADTTRIGRVNFEDDNLFANPEYALKAIDYARLKLNAPAITAENGLDAAFLHNALLERLLDAGLEQLNLSLGSVDPRILAQAHRNDTAGKVAALTAQAAARNVASVSYFICGLPGDTGQTVIDNLLFLASLETKIGISLFYPVPGIDGFEDESVFLDTSPVLCCSSSAFPWTKSLSTHTLVTAFRLARLVNLMKDAALRSTHGDLVRKTLSERRLYTYRKTGGIRSVVPVLHTDEDLVRAVVSQLDVDTGIGRS